MTPVRPPRRRKARNLVVPVDSEHSPSIYINELDQSPQSHSYDNQSFQSHDAHGNGNRSNGRFEHTLHV